MRRSALAFLSITRFAAVTLAALAASEATAIAAGPGPSLDLRGFHAPTDPASGISMEPASSPNTLEWNMGVWLAYAARPITLRDPSTNAIAFDVLSHQLTGDLTAGVGFAQRFALGVDLPFAIAQVGDDPTLESKRALGDAPIPRQAIGDLGLTGKITLMRPTSGELGGFALALHERFTFPTGDEASYLGEGSVSSETRLLAEYRLLALGVHLAAGVKLRGDLERFACASTPAPDPQKEDALDACPTRFKNELPFGFGISVRPQALGLDNAGRWTWFLEARGHTPLSPMRPLSTGSARVASLELDAGARLAIRDVSLLAGVGTSLIGAVGGAPLRVILSVGWAPREHDADGDGVEDDRDQCQLPEDRDGFQDDDGCPELDDDDDGVPDGDDKCPKVAEDEDGFQDDDGCPDPDNDGDKIPDVDDACPVDAGAASPVREKNGCPVRDKDGDGINDGKDKCPEVAEDRDSFEDDDGCPDPDNDDDDILDVDDACPDVPGIMSANAKERGCPDPDRDHDTIDDVDDKCPDEAEVWNGLDDGDGCADGDAKKPRKLLAEVKEAKAGPTLEVTGPVKFAEGGRLEAESEATLRAIASQLLARRGLRVAIGVRPKPKGGAEDANARASVIAEVIRRFTRSDSVVDVVSWDLVKDVPGAAALGLGFKLLAPKAAVAAEPAPATKP